MHNCLSAQSLCSTWFKKDTHLLIVYRFYILLIYSFCTMLTLRLLLSLRSGCHCQSVDDNLYYRSSVLPHLQYRSCYTTHSLCSLSVTSNDFFHIRCHISLLLSTPWRRHYIYITPPFWLWINLYDIHSVYTRVGNSLHFLRNVSFYDLKPLDIKWVTKNWSSFSNRKLRNDSCEALLFYWFVWSGILSECACILSYYRSITGLVFFTLLLLGGGRRICVMYVFFHTRTGGTHGSDRQKRIRNYSYVWNRCADDRQHETKRMNVFCSGDGNGRNGAAGQGGLWYVSKESFPDFINLRLHSYGECKNSSAEIPLYGSHSFLLFPFPPFSFLFFIFPITALAELQNLSFFNGLLTLQTALQHSGARIAPPPHLCVHTNYTLPLKALWYPLQRPPRNVLALASLRSCSVFDHSPAARSLTSCSGYISLSVLCKHCTHILARTWSATFFVYTSRG